MTTKERATTWTEATMAMAWLRLYTSVISDLKLRRLTRSARWRWIELLCVARERDGVLPESDEIAFLLRDSESAVASDLAALRDAGLIDETPRGLAPHNWSGRQYASDAASSTERVRKWRQKRRNGRGNVSRNVAGNVSETVTETVARNVTETLPDSDSEVKRFSQERNVSPKKSTRPHAREAPSSPNAAAPDGAASSPPSPPVKHSNGSSPAVDPRTGLKQLPTGGKQPWVFLDAGSPEYEAWKAAGYRVNKFPNPNDTSHVGGEFPTRWPPEEHAP